MARTALQIEIEGLKGLQAQMEDAVRELGGEGLLRTMRDVTLKVQAQAMKNAPVDTGRLRASITPKITRVGPEVRGVVGSNVDYAPFMEFGTRPHWPPPGALATWARRHGIPEFLVARAIATKGTSPRRYFRRAFEANLRYIKRQFNAAIVAIFEKKRD